MKKVLMYICLLLCVVICSCTSSKDVAESYFDKITNSENKKEIQVYVCMPTEVIHTNQTLNHIDNFALLSETAQDSIIKAETKFLNKLDDDKFIDLFAKNLKYHLEHFGATVKIVFDADELPQTLDNKTFVMNIVQIEAEEFIKQSRSEYTEANGTYYHYDYNLKGFSTNVWYKLNGGDDVYYKNFECMDVFNGEIDQINDVGASISGYFKRVSISDVYNSALTAGKESAVMFAEKILNDYLKSNGYNYYYYAYDPQYNRIIQLDKGFEKVRSFKKLDSK